MPEKKRSVSRFGVTCALAVLFLLFVFRLHSKLGKASYASCYIELLWGMRIC